MIQKTITILSLSICLLSSSTTFAQNKVFAVGLQATTKFILEDFNTDAFYGGGVFGEWYPYGNVAVRTGFNYYNGISKTGFTRVEKNRNDVTPSFQLVDMATYFDRMNIDVSTKFFLFRMEYDDPFSAYALLGLTVDYLEVSNDIASYNATNYKFPDNANGNSTQPIDEETMLGLYFNIGGGLQYNLSYLTIFVEGSYALVGSHFKAEEKQYKMKRNVNGSVGVSYRFTKKR
jgi:hypothetical protein